MPIFTRTPLTQHQRLAVPAHLFGVAFPLIETTIYNFASAIAERYTGGYWHMYRISNGGFYLAVDSPTDWEIKCPNHYASRVTSDAMGLIVCLYTYSHFSFTLSEQDAKICAEQFHVLREYALDHLEKSEIFGAID